MMSEIVSYKEREEQFNKLLVREYLKFGSVDEVLRSHRYDLPISFAGYHRLLDRWGVVKTVGRKNNLLGEALEFMEELAEERLPLERLYKRLPPSFQTSVGSMHRILSYVKKGITRRVGVGLVITQEGEDEKILVANDVSAPSRRYGKEYGSLSVPIGFSRKRDLVRRGIKRILQHEVFAQLTIDREFPDEVIPAIAAPFMFVDIADVLVSVYNIKLPVSVGVSDFSSYKLANHRFVASQSLISGNEVCRAGVMEIVEGYLEYLRAKQVGYTFGPFRVRSRLNQHFLALEEA